MSTPIDFEKIVKDLYEIKVSGQFQAYYSKKYKGLRSDHEHQIDFSLEGEIADIKMLILGECKQYAKAVSLDRVMAFAYRILDISAHKGILVSSNGFQAGSHKIAKSAGIALVVCRNNSLNTVLARGTDDAETSVSSFLNTIAYPSANLEYAILDSDDTCKLVKRDILFTEIAGS